MALWTFVCGAALVWLVMHLRRNANIRKNLHENGKLHSERINVLQRLRETLYKFNLSDRRVEHLGPACFRLTGYEAEGLERMAFNGFLQRVHPDDCGGEVLSAGEGAALRVCLPVEERAHDAAADDSPEAADPWRGYGTALIADDETAILDITGSLLKRLGFRVISAADGLAAVDLYTKHAESITFILMDINMPGISGLEAALQIRHINPKVPILFMSGYPRQEVMERFEKQPRTEFIKKPFESTALTAAIRSVMDAGQEA